MRQLQLDEVGVEAHFIEMERGDSSKTVGCHLVFGVAQPTQRGIQRVLAQASVGGSKRGKHKPSMSRDGVDLSQDLHSLS